MKSSENYPKKVILRTSFLLWFVVLTSCKYSPPKVELCAYHGPSNDLVCNDPRLDEEDYIRKPKTGDLCTAPESYKNMKEYAMGLREKLIKCERKR